MKQLVKTSFILLSSTLFLFLSSCATTVNVRLTRPAQLDLNGAKTIAVLPIQPSSYYREYNTEVSIGHQIFVNSFYQLFEIKDPNEQMAIDSLRTQIERGLLDSPYIKLVSSDAVERSLKKGTLNPADVYLTGEVTYFDVDDIRREERREVRPASGDRLAEYAIISYWIREVELIFRYQIVDSTTEKVISYREIRCSNSSSKYESRNALPGAYSLLESDIRAAARKILQELQPYTVTKSITLLESKTKDKELKARMKSADSLADDSKISQASEEFQKIYDETGLVEAGYNAAILQEALGNFSEAERRMTLLYKEHPDNRVAKGLSDIQYEIKQANRLQKQIGETEKESEDLEAIEEDDEDLDLDF